MTYNRDEINQILQLARKYQRYLVGTAELTNPLVRAFGKNLSVLFSNLALTKEGETIAQQQIRQREGINNHLRLIINELTSGKRRILSEVQKGLQQEETDLPSELLIDVIKKLQDGSFSYHDYLETGTFDWGEADLSLTTEKHRKMLALIAILRYLRDHYTSHTKNEAIRAKINYIISDIALGLDAVQAKAQCELRNIDGIVGKLDKVKDDLAQEQRQNKQVLKEIQEIKKSLQDRYCMLTLMSSNEGCTQFHKVLNSTRNFDPREIGKQLLQHSSAKQAGTALFASTISKDDILIIVEVYFLQKIADPHLRGFLKGMVLKKNLSELEVFSKNYDELTKIISQLNEAWEKEGFSDVIQLINKLHFDLPLMMEEEDFATIKKPPKPIMQIMATAKVVREAKNNGFYNYDLSEYNRQLSGTQKVKSSGLKDWHDTIFYLEDRDKPPQAQKTEKIPIAEKTFELKDVIRIDSDYEPGLLMINGNKINYHGERDAEEEIVELLRGDEMTHGNRTMQQFLLNYISQNYLFAANDPLLVFLSQKGYLAKQTGASKLIVTAETNKAVSIRYIQNLGNIVALPVNGYIDQRYNNNTPVFGTDTTWLVTPIAAGQVKLTVKESTINIYDPDLPLSDNRELIEFLNRRPKKAKVVRYSNGKVVNEKFSWEATVLGKVKKIFSTIGAFITSCCKNIVGLFVRKSVDRPAQHKASPTVARGISPERGAYVHPAAGVSSEENTLPTPQHLHPYKAVDTGPSKEGGVHNVNDIEQAMGSGTNMAGKSRNHDKGEHRDEATTLSQKYRRVEPALSSSASTRTAIPEQNDAISKEEEPVENLS